MARRFAPRALKTKPEVMAALGGIAGASAVTGSSTKNTENWNRGDTFPSKYFLVMNFALWNLGFYAPAELWGQVVPAQRKRALAAMIEAAQKQRAVA